jgi:hypothetical protein
MTVEEIPASFRRKIASAERLNKDLHFRTYAWITSSLKPALDNLTTSAALGERRETDAPPLLA